MHIRSNLDPKKQLITYNIIEPTVIYKTKSPFTINYMFLPLIKMFPLKLLNNS